MRTTVDIPDKLYRRLKSKAAIEGHSVKSLILTSVEKELGSAEENRKRKSLTLPLVHSKHPGALRLTGEKIYGAIPFP
jgi:hypothetical protein